MKYSDLRDFIKQLEKIGQLKRISQPISTDLTMTEISDRTLRAEGPALLFENPTDKDGVPHGMPVLIYDKTCSGSKSYFSFTDEFIHQESTIGSAA